MRRRARIASIGLFLSAITANLGSRPAVAAPVAGSQATGVETEPDEAFADPRARPLPRQHRARLGLQLQYLRASTATDGETGDVQDFHLIPLQLDVAYQVQVARVVMIRPSFALGANVGNTLEAMPLVLQPQLFAGYQGPLLGAAAGYGYLGIPIQNKDAVSEPRGGLGQPVLQRAHQVGAEVSLTTRVHSGRPTAPGAGEFSVIVRVSGVNARVRHFESDGRRWRALLTLNLGWYFGDGRRAAARKSARSSQMHVRFPGPHRAPRPARALVLLPRRIRSA